MSEMAMELKLTDLEIADFTASLPPFVSTLARLVLYDHFTFHSIWSFARVLQKTEPKNELIDYIANYDEQHLSDAYPNVMEDVLNDWIARWRSGTL
jgi:hypothetical protein